MNTNGSNQVNLTNNRYADTMPSWTPDSEFVGFVSDRSSSTFQVHLIRPDGSDLIQVTKTAEDKYWPTWRLSCENPQ